MSTNSTRSRADKQTRKTNKQRQRDGTASAAKLNGGASGAFAGKEAARNADWLKIDLPENVWRIGTIAIFIVALLLRFVALELNPMHHDEGVNGFFLLKLMREGVYHYDPANYHGPTLYYFTLPVALLFDKLIPVGLSVFAVRAVPAVFGLATVALIFALRRQIGSLGALTAAALIAVSPGNVYNSRYFIHETMFLFFTFALVIAVLRFYETTRASYLIFAAISAALLFATKETSFISIGVILLAFAITQIFFKWRSGEAASSEIASGKGRTSFEGGLARFGGAARLFTLLLIALAVFVAVYVIFYSSFFTNWKGVKDSLETFKIWQKTGSEAHTKPFQTYLIWLKDEEAALFALSIIGACLALWRSWRGHDAFALFAALWGFGLLAAYSLIAYKTPWLALNFILPLALVGGYAIDTLCKIFRRNFTLQMATLALALTAVACGLYQTISLNFFHYDDDRYIYVYAHTQRDFLRLIKEIQDRAAAATTKNATPIAIDAPEYWPLPWYLRDYKGVAYYGRATTNTEPLVITSEQQAKEFEATNGAQYELVGKYNMRPGVVLMLYARRNAV